MNEKDLQRLADAENTARELRFQLSTERLSALAHRLEEHGPLAIELHDYLWENTPEDAGDTWPEFETAAALDFLKSKGLL